MIGDRYRFGRRPLSTSPLAPTTMQSSVEQYGITWTFDQAYPVGQFVNGDYFVVANSDVTIVDIDPMSTDIDGRTMHGSMLNPTVGDTQAYDSQPSAGGYAIANNVGRPNGQDISEANPLNLSTGSSLVSTRSREEPALRPHVQGASVLTAVAEAPPAGSFRPPYSGENKSLNWNVSQIRWDLWEANKVIIINNVTQNMPTIQTMERWVERPWIDHGGGTWTHQYIRPLDNTQNYGRQFSWETSQITLALLLDLPREDIETLMIRFLQAGIDLYGVTNSAAVSGAGIGRFEFSTQGHLWHGAGGISAGRKLQMLFPAIMLGDENMLAYADAGGFRSRHEVPWGDWKDGPGYPIFQAEQQHFYIHANDTESNGGPYPDHMEGLPEWSSSYILQSGGDPSWGASYRWMSNAYMGSVLAGHMIQHTGTYEHGVERTGRQLWNWEPIFDYMDRWLYYNDPSGGGTNAARQFVVDMWGEYRASFGNVWVP